MNLLQQFHFIRAEYLFAVIPLIFLCWMLLRKQLFSHNWQSVIDPALLPHLLIGQTSKASRTPIVLFFIGGLIAILALAGPVWEKLPQPVFKQQSALVILLDLSRSMDAQDIKPSRLTRARHKVSDILALRKEGQTALIGYAADAFTISPLTDDTATINSLVPSLDTNIMPAQGSRVDTALNKAIELLHNSGASKGDILLITDGISNQFEESFKKIRNQGHSISILGIGTKAGGPITLAQGGFLKDDSGDIVIPKLNANYLRSMASTAGGRYSSMTADDTDIKELLSLMDLNRIKSDNKKTNMKTDSWQEEGPWLLLLLIPLSAFAFRKGYLSLLIFFVLPFPQPAQALNWDELWLNDNQRAALILEQNKASDAAALFSDPDWKASAHFKAGEYEQALEQFEMLNNNEAHYNRGNTLAKMGRIKEAIDAYDLVLKTEPKHEDALHNKQQLENQQQQQSDNNEDKQDSQQNDDKNSDEQDSSSQKNQSDEQQNNQNQKESESEQENSDQSEQNEENQASEDEPEKKSENEAEKAAESDEENKDETQAQSQEQKDEDLSQQAKEQWLRRIPDDPGGLLRNKFNYLYQQQKKRQQEPQNW